MPADGAYTTVASMEGGLKDPSPSGRLTVATLRLHVSGAPGTYVLGVTQASCFTANGADELVTTDTPFTITIEGQ